jgi:type II secretory pathway component PulC
VGNALIKLILRNNVIIETEDGRRQRLTIDEETLKNPKVLQTGLAFPADSTFASLNPDEIQGGKTFQVTRNQIPSSSEEIQSFIDKFYLTPQTDQNSFGGFSVGRMRAGYLISQLGMRTGDVIKGLDDYEFTSPGDLEYLFQQLAQGGNFTVVVERRGQVQKLNVHVQ